MPSSYQQHSSLFVENKVTSSNSKEYAILCSAFAKRVLRRVLAKDGADVPEGAEFLSAETHTKNVHCTAGELKQEPTAFWFVQDVPVPRPLPVLDLLVEVNLLKSITLKGLFEKFNIGLVNQEEWTKQVDEFVYSVINACFSAKEEADWWYSAREVNVLHSVMKSAYKLRIVFKDAP